MESPDDATLLHEMIHALLFVTDNNRDHDAHGEEFCKHMRRINGRTGAKISVYHNFHDEVDEYRTHWWLCNGPCQKRRPYFGYVKRAMNRPPSANDPWWAEHKQTCGGTYTKVKEPENYSKKGNGKSSLPTTQNPKIPEGHGKPRGADIRTIIPFSGKGFKLGEQGAASHWAKIASPGNILKPAAESKISKPENPARFPQTSPSRTPNRTLVDLVKTDVTAIMVAKKPKISVANTKVFKNVNGSPVKMFPISGRIKSANPPSTKDKHAVSASSTTAECPSLQTTEAFSKTPPASEGSSSNRMFPVFGSINTSDSRPPKESQRFPSSGVAQKRISSHVSETATKSPSASQGARSDVNVSHPHKRPKMDNKTAIEDFFAKPPYANVRTGESCATSRLGNSSPEVTISSVHTISTSSQSSKVRCPICQTLVLESKINDHIDLCLTNSFLSEESMF